MVYPWSPRGHPVLRRFWLNEDGATAIEYCLIAGIISIAIAVGATAIGTKLRSQYFMAAANGLS
ncbi:MAG: Flp family type IVb pilin [Janthinobacterium lividum]